MTYTADELETVKERFWSKVDNLNSPGCWLWTGSKSQKGYGLFYWVHPETGRGRMELAHRVAFYLWNGRLPRYVIHGGCGNPLCVRPTHLCDQNPFKGIPTSQTKKRLPASGGRSSFFSEQDALNIRTAADRGESEESLARRFGVEKRDIARVTMGKTFKSVGGPIRSSRHRGIQHYRQEWLRELREIVAQ